MWSDDEFRQYQERQSERARVHYASPLPAVTIPILQSLISGVLVGLSAATLAWVLEISSPFLVFPVAMILTITLSWFLNLRRWAGIVSHLERLSGIDLNQDGQIADQPKPVVRVEIKSEDSRRVQIAELPVTQDKLADLARGLLAGQSFSEATWSGAGALFSRNEFRQLRDTLIARGLMRWTDPEHPQQGIELTNSGKAAMRVFASDTLSPTLAERKE